MKNRIEKLTEGQKKGMYEMLVNSANLTQPEVEMLEQLTEDLNKNVKESANTKKFLKTVDAETELEEKIENLDFTKLEREGFRKELAKNLKKQQELAKKINRVQWEKFIEPTVLYTWEER